MLAIYNQATNSTQQDFAISLLLVLDSALGGHRDMMFAIGSFLKQAPAIGMIAAASSKMLSVYRRHRAFNFAH
jgi:hypothetical protein